jgi:hypothetical protein
MSCLVLRQMPHTQRRPLRVLAGLHSCRASYEVSYAIFSDIPACSRMYCSVFTCFARFRRFRTSSQFPFQSFFAGVVRSRCRTFSWFSRFLNLFHSRGSPVGFRSAPHFVIFSSFHCPFVLRTTFRTPLDTFCLFFHLAYICSSCLAHLAVSLRHTLVCLPSGDSRVDAESWN